MVRTMLRTACYGQVTCDRNDQNVTWDSPPHELHSSQQSARLHSVSESAIEQRAVPEGLHGPPDHRLRPAADRPARAGRLHHGGPGRRGRRLPADPVQLLPRQGRRRARPRTRRRRRRRGGRRVPRPRPDRRPHRGHRLPDGPHPHRQGLRGQRGRGGPPGHQLEPPAAGRRPRALRLDRRAVHRPGPRARGPGLRPPARPAAADASSSACTTWCSTRCSPTPPVSAPSPRRTSTPCAPPATSCPDPPPPEPPPSRRDLTMAQPALSTRQDRLPAVALLPRGLAGRHARRRHRRRDDVQADDRRVLDPGHPLGEGRRPPGRALPRAPATPSTRPR